MKEPNKSTHIFWGNALTEPSGKYKFYCLILLLIYAGILASFPVDIFLDRDNYLTFAEFAIEILTRDVTDSILVAFMNEPLY